jgi:hypothetical protein
MKDLDIMAQEVIISLEKAEHKSNEIEMILSAALNQIQGSSKKARLSQNGLWKRISTAILLSRARLFDYACGRYYAAKTSISKMLWARAACWLD